jgi:hypothetical protein
MLGQAAAMLVSLPALLAAEFWAVALPALLDQRLTVAGPPNACFLESPLTLVRRPVILVIVNSAVLDAVCRSIGSHGEPMGG